MSDPAIHQQLLVSAPADSDPQETAEWRDAFRAVLQAAGPARAREFMDMLSAHGARPGGRLAAGARHALRQHHPACAAAGRSRATWRSRSGWPR